MEVGFAVSVGVTAFLAEALYGMTTFGTAITFQVGWAISYMLGVGDGEVAGAVVNLAVAELFMASVQAVHLRRHISWPLFCSCAPWYVSSVVLGSWLLLQIHNVWLKRALGFLLLLVALFRAGSMINCRRCGPGASRAHGERSPLLRLSVVPEEPGDVSLSSLEGALSSPQEARTTPPLASFSVQAIIAMVFTVSGTLGGLYGVAGPPQMLFVLLYAEQLDRGVWRGTNAMLRAVYSAARFGFLANAGSISFDAHAPWAEWGLMIGTGFAGLMVGNVLAPHINEELFRLLILLFLLCGGLLLSSSGWEEVQGEIVIGLLGLLGLVLLVLVGVSVYRRCCRPSSDEDEQARADASDPLDQPILQH